MIVHEVVGFHVEPTNICTLKCPGCARTQFINQWPKHWKNHSIDVTALDRFLDLDINNKLILLCGNYGDPIYHPNFVDLVLMLKRRGAVLKIVTNGSYKTAAWWVELTTNLDQKDQVVFSVDGTPENFAQYRINADWMTIQSAMEICVQAKCTTEWKFIPFAYNQHNIEQAKILSQNLGIDRFNVDPSDRFDATTMHYQPDSNVLGKRFASQQVWKQNHKFTVNPQCQDNRQHFISAQGYYTPCCNTADHRFYYKNEFGRNKKHFDISNFTFSEILQKPTVIEFYRDLTNHPVCQYNCPAI